MLLCCLLALPCAGMASLLVYLGGPDSSSDDHDAAATLFVSSSAGELSYDGLARAWDGSHGPKPTINAALAVSRPGDSVHVLPGTYLEDVNISGIDLTITGEGILKGTP